MQEAIAIFARAPVLGKVKTRLAAAIGDVAALDIYKTMLADSIALAQRAAAKRDDCKVLLCTTGPDIFPDELQKLEQRGTDLGEKIQSCFSDLKAFGAERIVIIGSDSPDLPSNFLTEALDALGENDLVLGPATDGGFTLIAARETPVQLFDGVEWSSKSTFSQVRKNTKELSVRMHELPECSDIDEAEDLVGSAGSPIG